MPWSAVARPTGRYGVLAKAFSSWSLAVRQACMLGGGGRAVTEASRCEASAEAELAAAARSLSPGGGGDRNSTAMVETAEASHQPASRSGIVATVPGVATGSTKRSSAAFTPEAALGPATPAKKIPNVTGMVTSTASQVMPLTAVPMISATLPITASPRCAMSLSRRVPPNAAKIRFAKPPNAANRAICRLPKPSYVIANNGGITSTARSIRSPAASDQAGHHAGPGPLRQSG